MAWRQARQAATTLLFWWRRLARLLIGWLRLARLLKLLWHTRLLIGWRRLALLLKLLWHTRLIGWLRLMPLLNPRWVLLGLLWFPYKGGTRPGNHGSAVRT